MNYEMNNYAEAVKKADRLGKIIVKPGDNELLLDIDSAEQYKTYKDRMEELSKLHKVVRIKEIPSSEKSGHRHIYISLVCGMEDEERIFLQLFLGSDPIREYLSLCLIRIGDPHPILLFENPPSKEE